MADIIRAEKTRWVLAVTLGTMLLRLPVQWGMALLLPNPGNDPALFYASLILQEVLLWGAPSLLMRPWRSKRLVIRKASLGDCMTALLLGLAAQITLMAVTPWWVELTGAKQAAVMLPQNEIQWVLAVLALVVIPAVAEEAFFRGGLLTGLCESTSTVNAMALCSVIFALMHGSLAGIPAHMGISLLCTMVMLIRGRLRLPILLHMGYNGAALLLHRASPGWMPALSLGMLLLAAMLWMLMQIPWRGRLHRIQTVDGVLLGLILLGAAALYLPEMI